MKNTLIVGQHTFELVDFIPTGYHIWNIGKNMEEGYLPLVQVGGYDGCQVIGIKKALPLADAQKVLMVTSYAGTPKAIEAYIEKNKNKQIAERMKEALEILLTVKGVENL